MSTIYLYRRTSRGLQFLHADGNRATGRFTERKVFPSREEATQAAGDYVASGYRDERECALVEAGAGPWRVGNEQEGRP